MSTLADIFACLLLSHSHIAVECSVLDAQIYRGQRLR